MEKDKKNRISEIQKINTCPQIITHRTNIFYFTGTAQTGFLYIPQDGEAVFFVRRYAPRARVEARIANVVEIRSVREIPGIIADMFGCVPDTIGMELDVIPVNDFHFFEKLFAPSKIIDTSGLINKIRMIKSDWEIEQMEKTAELSCRTYKHMRSIIRSGISEMEFAAEAELFARKHGHGGLIRTRHYQSEAYPWHILSGKNGGLPGYLDSPASGQGTSPAFPSGAGYKLLESHEPIMVDFATVYNGYHMDETRMFSIGNMEPKAYSVSQAVMEILDAILEKLRPGIPVHELFDHSVEVAKKLGYASSYLGIPGYQVSFIGHGIGLDIVEPPIIARGKKEPIEAGMVLAIEPKIVFENEFIAGIESVVSVTETGFKRITKIPEEIFIC